MEAIKDELKELLHYMEWQLDNGKCTAEQMNSMHSVLKNQLHVDATISDIAEHYHQSESNVRNAIARRYVGEPKRKLMYDFLKFIKIKPKKWN